MRLHALKHLTTAAKALGPSRRLVVLGSSSLLAMFPELGEMEGPVQTTLDADILPEPVDEGIARMLAEAVGPASFFSQQHGYHADVLHPDIVEALPPGWEGRLVALEDVSGVFCLDPHDAAAMKTVAGRGKDVALVRHLLQTGKIQAGVLRERLAALNLGEKEQFRAARTLSMAME
jgi:hypothetical protein